jgi:hypothetical protein
VFCCIGACVQPAWARHQIELESTYLGDGWFQYELRSVDDHSSSFLI